MVDRIALVLSIVGGIVWAIIGLFGFNLVGWMSGGANSMMSRIIYTIIGIASIWCISLLFRRMSDPDLD